MDGSVAVALFNGQDGPVGNVSLQFEDVGFTAVDRVTVRDLVRRRDVGGGRVAYRWPFSGRSDPGPRRGFAECDGSVGLVGVGKNERWTVETGFGRKAGGIVSTHTQAAHSTSLERKR